MTLNVLFFVVLILLCLLAIRGFKRGFLGIVFGLIAWIFMIFFVQWASPKAYENLKKDEEIVSAVSQAVEEALDEKTKDITIENASSVLEDEKETSLADYLPKEAVAKYEEMVSALKEFQSGLSLVEEGDLKEDIMNQANASFNEKKEEIVLSATEIVTDYILHGIATLIAIVIGMILCGFVWLLIQVINHTPVIGTMSHFAGLIFGLLEGIFVTWIFMYIISFTTMTKIGGSAFSQIQENEFLLYLYNNNILMDLFK